MNRNHLYSILSLSQENTAFIFTINTVFSGSPSNTFIFPQRAETTPNFVINWGDNQENIITSVDNAALTHIYANPGIYEITVSGTGVAPFFNNSGDRSKLVEVKTWGACEIGEGSFSGCDHLIVSAVDQPNISSLRNTFSGCFSLVSNPSMQQWEVSAITTMEGCFENCALFNLDLSGWNITNVTDMSRMLDACGMDSSNYNATLIGWSLQNIKSKVTLGRFRSYSYRRRFRG